jgi:hypothetical protein
MELDFGAEFVAQFVFEAGDVGIGGGGLCGGGGGEGGGWPGAAGLEFGDESLGLPDVETVFDGAFGGVFLGFFVGEAEDDFGMADGEAVFAEVALDDEG